MLSCYTNCYGPAGVWTAAERAASLGLKHIELALRPHNMGGLVIPESAVLTERTDRATFERYVAHLDALDLRVASFNIGGVDPLTTAGRDLLLQRMLTAYDRFPLGRKIVVAGAGGPQDDNAWNVLVETFRMLGDFAGERGITIALETHAGPTANADAMLATLDRIDHPAVRLNFDTGNIAYYNDGLNALDELARALPMVASVHLKDNRGRLGDWYFPAPGDGGAIDFAQVARILDDAGFAGPRTIEIEGVGGEPEPGSEERHARVARGVAHLTAAGFTLD